MELTPQPVVLRSLLVNLSAEALALQPGLLTTLLAGRLLLRLTQQMPYVWRYLIFTHGSLTNITLFLIYGEYNTIFYSAAFVLGKAPQSSNSIFIFLDKKVALLLKLLTDTRRISFISVAIMTLQVCITFVDLSHAKAISNIHMQLLPIEK